MPMSMRTAENPLMFSINKKFGMGAQRSKQTLPNTNDFHLVSRACYGFYFSFRLTILQFLPLLTPNS